MEGLLTLLALFGFLVIAKWLCCLRYERDCRADYNQKLAQVRSEGRDIGRRER